MSENRSYPLDIEISPVYIDKILHFVRFYYLRQQPENFRNIRKTREGLFFTASDDNGLWNADFFLKASSPIHVDVDASISTPDSVLDEIKEDLLLVVKIYEEQINRSTLYFSWVEGEDIIPEELPTIRKRLSIRMLTSNMLLLYILFFSITIILFLLFGVYGVFAFIFIQFCIVLLSDKIFMRTGHWKITEKNPYVHVVQYNLSNGEFDEFQKKFSKKMIMNMKSEIYKRSLAVGKEPSCELGEEVFESYGMTCNPQHKSSKVVNVYSIVKTAVDRFGLPMPSIVISNNMVPNAAATGPSPTRGVVLITTGLLVHLEEDEILSVIGHELSHLQGRDPLILFGIIAGEFILRLTVLLPVVVLSPFLYLFIVIWSIYFVAKFFEARADLVSAMKIGQPEVLAESLRKIGYARLAHERKPSSRIPSWLRLDTHPPLYFRIDRLERMKDLEKIKNPLLTSIKDVFLGFKSAFGL
ncbi:M48 family metalloprotease [Methanobacterium aggregans]|uniref:M48 family metalloprotease n=1 Tax=Methanobacterium aggregans TaxID=1615586 RepID=UPI00320DB251